VLRIFPLKYQSKKIPESGHASSKIVALEADTFFNPK
jgi:hypothetical protein